MGAWVGRGDRIRHKMALKEQKEGKGDKKVQKKLFTRKNEVGGIKRLEEGTGAVREEAEVGEVFIRDREGTKYYVRDGNLVKEGEEEQSINQSGRNRHEKKWNA